MEKPSLLPVRFPFSMPAANDNHVAPPASGLIKGHGNTAPYMQDGDHIKMGNSYWSFEKYMSH